MSRNGKGQEGEEVLEKIVARMSGGCKTVGGPLRADRRRWDRSVSHLGRGGDIFKPMPAY